MPIRNEDYLNFIRAKPCIACGRHGPSEPHHYRTATNSGGGQKPDDTWVLPLCSETCHIPGVHRIGQESFFNHAGVDPLTKIIEFLTEYMEMQKWKSRKR